MNDGRSLAVDISPEPFFKDNAGIIGKCHFRGWSMEQISGSGAWSFGVHYLDVHPPRSA